MRFMLFFIRFFCDSFLYVFYFDISVPFLFSSAYSSILLLRMLPNSVLRDRGLKSDTWMLWRRFRFLKLIYFSSLGLIAFCLLYGCCISVCSAGSSSTYSTLGSTILFLVLWCLRSASSLFAFNFLFLFSCMAFSFFYHFLSNLIKIFSIVFCIFIISLSWDSWDFLSSFT